LWITVLQVVEQDTKEIMCVLLLFDIDWFSPFKLENLSKPSWCVTQLLWFLKICEYLPEFNNNVIINEPVEFN